MLDFSIPGGLWRYFGDFIHHDDERIDGDRQTDRCLEDSVLTCWIHKAVFQRSILVL